MQKMQEKLCKVEMTAKNHQRRLIREAFMPQLFRRLGSEAMHLTVHLLNFPTIPLSRTSCIFCPHDTLHISRSLGPFSLPNMAADIRMADCGRWFQRHLHSRAAALPTWGSSSLVKAPDPAEGYSEWVRKRSQ